MAERLYRLTNDRGVCAGFVVRGGLVVRAAPIIRWFRGKPLRAVLAWAARRPGTTIEVYPEDGT